MLYLAVFGHSQTTRTHKHTHACQVGGCRTKPLAVCRKSLWLFLRDDRCKRKPQHNMPALLTEIPKSNLLFIRCEERPRVTFPSLHSKWLLLVFEPLVSQQEDTSERCTLTEHWNCFTPTTYTSTEAYTNSQNSKYFQPVVHTSLGSSLDLPDASFMSSYSQ